MGLSLSLNLIPLVLGTINYGPLFFMIFSIENVLSVLLVIALTALLYTLVLKFFDGEKLKDIINYFQILLAFVFAFGYQLVIRVFNMQSMNIEYVPKFWHALLPSMWFAAPFGIYIDGNKQPFLIFLCLLAIVGPILLITIYIKGVVPYFEKNLQKLNENGGNVSKRSENRKEFIAALVCKNKIERSMFKFTQNIVSLAYFKVSNKEMPFSVKFAIADSGKLIGPALIAIVILGAFAGIHIIIRNNMKFVSVYAVLLLIVNIILWKISFKVSWKDLKM